MISQPYLRLQHGWVPAMAEVYCPAAAIHRSGTISDSARTHDDWRYAVIGNAVFAMAATAAA